MIFIHVLLDLITEKNSDVNLTKHHVEILKIPENRFFSSFEVERCHGLIRAVNHCRSGFIRLLYVIEQLPVTKSLTSRSVRPL